MDHLWTPWRSTYITSTKTETGCIFCKAAATPDDDESNLVVERGEHCFVILNRFPYTSGHLMIAPYAHVSRLNDATQKTVDEMTRFVRWAETVFEQAYRPEGINIGMNLGRAAGAGIAEHIHMHVLPRWTGDANFMTSVANTRVIPESLDQTYSKLKQALGSVKAG
jgi:ATP adenylyltransferase